jgi:hypothetical protein
MITYNEAQNLINNEGFIDINSRTGYVKVQEWSGNDGRYFVREDHCICKMRKVKIVENKEWWEAYHRRTTPEELKNYENWTVEQKELDKKYFAPIGRSFQFKRQDKYLIDMTAEEFVAAYNEGKKWKMKAENNRLLKELNILN